MLKKVLILFAKKSQPTKQIVTSPSIVKQSLQSAILPLFSSTGAFKARAWWHKFVSPLRNCGLGVGQFLANYQIMSK